ncbi:MAG: hypothetical protein ACC656_11045, partial [Candidatus Heimdallarchaeota archaeon]
NDFNFVRQYNHHEFLVKLDEKFPGIKSKNFIKMAQYFYSAKIVNLLLQNYQKTRSIKYDIIIYGTSLDIESNNLMIEEIGIRDNIMYTQNNYWFAKSQIMQTLFNIYDKMIYVSDMSFKDMVKQHLKHKNIKIIEVY